MTAAPLPASSLRSPCIGLCRIDPRDSRCGGCRRTLDEITRWPTASAAWRDQVIVRLAAEAAQGG